mmetsp:Transcript_3600/g.10355  ORF Transcript_3600/g.10355 Transcript_3600/m.10355 type:complete len:347 (+) Transcript_3600:145-1185(+)
MSFYDQNYRNDEAALKEPSIMTHFTNVLVFKRTVVEACYEYQLEKKKIANERHAIQIQRRVRGMRDRERLARLHLQKEKVTIIQAAFRSWLARKVIDRRRRELQILSLFASAERKAVMKLELAFINRRERKRAAAVAVMQSQFSLRKARLRAREEMREELTKRKLVLLMAKGETKAALRIQYAWYRYKSTVLNKRREAEDRDALARRMEEERLREEVRAREQRETAIMNQPVGKKARSKPLGFQKKQMHIDASQSAITYRKFPENPKAKTKGIPFRSVVALELAEGTGAEITLQLDADAVPGAGVKKGPLVLRCEDRETAEVWAKNLRESCGLPAVAPLAGGPPGR